MQTVQLQCGSCSNMMAISVEHLGAQVRCPHCSAVVQTPPRSALGPQPGPDPQGAAVTPPYQPPAQQPAPSIQVPERESIFSDPEPSDDLFGGDASPRIQMPEPRHTVAAQETATALADAPVDDEEEQVDMSAMRGRIAQQRKSGSFATTILVFLVPYALCTSAFIGYLLIRWQSKEDMFKWLPDPKDMNEIKELQKKGKVRSGLPFVDAPMAAAFKTTLQHPITMGSIEITPLKVVDNGGDLTLTFKAKNLSDKLTFAPIEQSFFEKPVPVGKETPLPLRCFTFLERAGSKSDAERVFGGDLHKPAPELAPGQDCIVELSTENSPAARKAVKALLAGNKDGNFLWRIQVRRGTDLVYGSELWLSAVIGVEFSAKDVVNAG